MTDEKEKRKNCSKENKTEGKNLCERVENKTDWSKEKEKERKKV